METSGTLADLIHPPRFETRAAQKLLFWSPKSRLSYQVASREALRLAHYLVECGLRKGDRLLLALPNGRDFLIVFFGALRAGAVIVLRNNDFEIAEPPPGVRWVASYPKVPEANTIHRHDAVEFLEIVDGAPRRWTLKQALSRKPQRNDSSLPELGMDDEALVLYTSGSDGTPKGVIKTHRNLDVELDYLAEVMGHGVNRFLSVLPWTYIYGLIHHLLLPARLGATVYYLPRYTHHSIGETIARHQIDVFVGVPSIYRVIARVPDLTSNLSLRWGVSSGAALDPTTVRRLREKRWRIIEIYGSTETGAIAINLDKAERLKSVGRLVPYMELQINRDAPVGMGNADALSVRGPTVSCSYYRGGRRIPATDPTGWYTVGDHGHLTKDGELHLLSRATRIIKVDGRRVSLDEIEETLLKLPGVIDVAAFVRLDEVHGEIPEVHVTSSGEHAWTESSLRDCCRQLFPSHKRPRSVQLVESIRREERGKTVE